MEKKYHNPPRWAQRFLQWYCKPELLEDLQGDLHEYFQRNVHSKNVRMARLIYWFDVFKFLRPYTVRKPELINLLIHWIMIGSYIKTSGRNIVRNKLFSTINIVGLAVSMTVGLLMIGLLSELTSYDKFHIHHDRIYRVTTKYIYLGNPDDNFYASTSLRVGKAIQEEVTGVEDVAILRRGFSGDVVFSEKTIPLEGFWANNAFLNVFTFPMTNGNAANALKNPYSIVLTKTAARKLFGDEEALGKTLMILSGDHEYTVTGIIEDVPAFSHMKFDMLCSMSTREQTEKENPQELAWDNMWNFYVYLLLPEHADLHTLQVNLNAITDPEKMAVKNTDLDLMLQPLDDIALGDELNNSVGPVMSKSVAWIIGILAFVVILSACFNYTNLSIARSLRRAKEVGIRKVAGARRSHVMGQFILEAVIISVLALVCSIVLFLLIKPFFFAVSDQFDEMLLLNLTPEMVIYFILLAILVGIISGFLPALFFSKVNPTRALKDTYSHRNFKGVNLRRFLIVLQYSISLMFITAAIIGYNQYKYFLAFDLGFTTENIVNIELQGNKAELLINELSEMPEVSGISRSSVVTSIGNYWGANIKYTDPLDSAHTHQNLIDENYLLLHDHTIIAGRNFNSKQDEAEENEVIVNEQVLKRFNIAHQDPAKAIGEVMEVNRKKMTIIGVVKDFHYGKAMDYDTHEVIFRHLPQSARFVNIKIATADWPGTFDKFDAAWKKIDTIHPLSAKFYKEQLEHAYRDFSSMIKIIGSLAFLAICIASMGLLGMVVFTTETRLKEISIRKVLGADDGALIYLLSKGFLLLLGISGLIALPLTYLFFDKVVLVNWQNHAPIGMVEMVTGFIAVLMIAFVVIGSRTLLATRSNPAEVLKTE